MRIIDLSHAISADMPVYPGTEGPRLEVATTIAKDGFAEKLLSMYSHTGTHMDAPGHILAGAKTLDAFEAGHFVGPARVLDVSSLAGPTIGLDFVRAQAGLLAGAAFVLLRSGWDRLWGQAGYYEGFPVLSVEAALALASLGLRGIGLDMISVDPVGSLDFPVHKALFGRGLVIIENLRGLEALGQADFSFCALPLKMPDADGSPVRAIALV